MTTAKPDHLPARLALLSDLNAARYLTEGLREGKESVPSIDLNQNTESIPGDEARASLHPVRNLLEDAMHKYRDEKPTQADAWLAPRLHATLRLTRRQAADKRFWNYLAFGVAPDYVVWRHMSERESDGKTPRVAAARFKGPHYTQTFSRLWWAAELFRNGSDYAPAVTACGQQDMLNTALRQDVMDHRPTAQAVVRLLDRGTVRTGREANALAAAVNAAGATLMYDVVAPDVDRDGEPLWDWIAEAETAGPVLRNVLPEGPREPPAPERSVTTLVDRFAELFADAPVRGREVQDS